MINKYELRIMRFLHSNTEVQIKINGADIEQPFLSDIGIPQGNGLNLVLFVIYRELALGEA